MWKLSPGEEGTDCFLGVDLAIAVKLKELNGHRAQL
jgi:hypothetical protein